MGGKGEVGDAKMDDYHIPTNAADFWLEDGTLMGRVIKPEVTLEDAQESLEALKKSLPRDRGVKRALVDLGDGVVVKRQTRKYLAQTTRVLGIEKAALVFHNPVQRIAASFFLGINKPEGDLKLFGDLREAEEWLKT
jgi:hypothetical protein